MRFNVGNVLTYLFLFLIPWQTRWIFFEAQLGGDIWEYGKMSIYVTEILLLLIIAFRRRIQFLPGSKKPVKHLLFTLLAVLLSLSFSVDTLLSAHALLHVLFAGLLFFVLLDKRLSTKVCAFSFLAGLSIPSLLGWGQVLLSKTFSSTLLGLASHDVLLSGTSVIETQGERLLRAYGSFSHPNVFGGFLVFALLLTGFMFYKKNTKIQEHSLLAFSILFVSTLLVTFSRSAWVGLAAALIVFAIFSLRARIRIPRTLFQTILLSSIALISMMVIFSVPLFTRFTPTERLEAKSLSERQIEYSQINSIVFKQPATGIGVGAYTVQLEQEFKEQSIWSYQPIHNVPLLIFAETGVIGFIAIVFWIVSIDRITHAFSRFPSGIFAMSFGTALLVVALLDHYLWTSWVGLALLAIVFAFSLRIVLEE